MSASINGCIKKIYLFHINSVEDKLIKRNIALDMIYHFHYHNPALYRVLAALSSVIYRTLDKITVSGMTICL